MPLVLLAVGLRTASSRLLLSRHGAHLIGAPRILSAPRCVLDRVVCSSDVLNLAWPHSLGSRVELM